MGGEGQLMVMHALQGRIGLGCGIDEVKGHRVRMCSSYAKHKFHKKLPNS